MAAERLLLIEDDNDIVQLLEDFLRGQGFETTSVSSVEQARTVLEQRTFDALVLDVMLPGQNGLSFCQELRRSSDIPIIMLTALGHENDRIQGLNLGADDYLCKPFSPSELVARINAVMRRVRSKENGIPKIKAYRFGGGWRLDITAREVYNQQGKQCALTSTEFDLLVALCQNAGIPISRDKLLEASYSGRAGQIERSVDVHISRLRQKIEHNPREPKWIKTVRLGGYVFTPEVSAE